MRIGFVCIANSCRSQMAEGFARTLGGEGIEVFSAGTMPAETVNEGAIQAMREIGIDISKQTPKSIDQLPPLDYLVTMGCGVQCPMHPARQVVEWQIPDPAGGPPELFREVRDLIRGQVLALLAESGKDSATGRAPEDVFRVLGDETRMRILMLLREEPLCVCQITGILGVSQAKVSRHLSRLRMAKFVTTVREEQYVRYRLNRDDGMLIGLLDAYASCMETENPYAQDRCRSAEKQEYLQLCRTRKEASK